ncbi:beta-propeller domain-containing protein [Embleya sp. NBC_00896]|uniref:beta-propeller domain-containing protein n=1 Tax=Embleya sp. NBC_00896 TaxID=2975961 RepID=UPI00386375B8|nr:beta-propeller domain-containing protein [Embleya sp. NBC_00896]
MRIHDRSKRRAAALPIFVLTAGLVVTGCTSSSGSKPDPDRPALVSDEMMRLAAYDSCGALVDDFRAAALRQMNDERRSGDSKSKSMPDGGAANAEEQPAAAPRQDAPQGLTADKAAPGAPSAPDHSTTNTQEQGVDEPDLVKTDGRRVLTIANGRLNVVDVATHRVTGTLSVPGARANDLLLFGDRALLIARSGPQTKGGSGKMAPIPGDPDGGSPVMAGSQARFVLVDLTAAPKVIGDLSVDGAYADARQIGSTARIVVRSQPRLKSSVNKSPGKAKDLIERSTAADWLPQYTLTANGRTDSGDLVGCDRVSRPQVKAGEPGHSGTATLSVLSFDLTGELGKGDPVTVAADVDHVYASDSNLYLATNYTQRSVSSDAKMTGGGPPTTTTAINQLDISGKGTPKLVGTGVVPGVMINEYAMSEHGGNLRVATTLSPGDATNPTALPRDSAGGATTKSVPDAFPGSAPPIAPRSSTESVVTVLARSGNRLTPIGRVGGLGRTERIFGVRFAGPIAYVVTFRQTDPLYTIDLSDPRNPKAVGELKINGYSAYLHPIADGRLIGVGQDATDGGQRTGTQVSLFDVSTLANPTRVAQYAVTGANSQAEQNPHAFLYWAKDGTVVLPVQGGGRPLPSQPEFAPGEKSPYSNYGYALVLRINGSKIVDVGRVTHPDASIQRSLVIGSDLWTVSTAGISVDTLADLRQVAWIPTG